MDNIYMDNMCPNDMDDDPPYYDYGCDYYVMGVVSLIINIAPANLISILLLLHTNTLRTCGA